MNTVYYTESPRAEKHVFLAGPTQRVPGKISWRSLFVDLISKNNLDLDVDIVIPEWLDGDHEENKRKSGWTGKDVVTWEDTLISSADVVVFWMPFTLIPNDMSSLPGFTTRLELGMCLANDPDAIIAGMPPTCDLGAGAIRYYCTKHGVKIHSTLEEVVYETLLRIS